MVRALQGVGTVSSQWIVQNDVPETAKSRVFRKPDVALMAAKMAALA